jgi:hypothetical protein
MSGRHLAERRAPSAGDQIIVEFVDAPKPDTREIMVIPQQGIPLRLTRDGVEYGLTRGHGEDPVTFDYFSVDPA